LETFPPPPPVTFLLSMLLDLPSLVLVETNLCLELSWQRSVPCFLPADDLIRACVKVS
jgi:hypothetical protein